MTMFNKPPLRLVNLVRQETQREITINRLTDLITEANLKVGCSYRVSRAFLTNLLRNAENVSFTWGHLVALNNYFKQRGLSLQQLPILETRGVFEVMADTSTLVIMLGAKPRPEEQRTDLSHWDRRSQSELQTEVQSQSVRPRLLNEDVLWGKVDIATLGAQNWYDILEADKSSVISIGSPLAALSSEIMLARMFGVKPFEPPRFRMGHQVPFCFVWLHKLAEDFRSAFGLTWRELHEMDPALAERVQNNKATAFLLGDQVHETPVHSNEWTMYGVIAAQRRASGNVWLVVSGLHGPATYGAATMVKQITDELPWAANQPSQVLWVPVKVLVRAPEPKPGDGDIREIVSVEFDGNPRIWPE